MTGRGSTIMERFLSWGTLALLLCWSVPVSAQPGGFDPAGLKFGAPAVAKPEFTTTLSPASAKSGDEVTLTIHVKLPKGYYIYGTKGDFGGRTIIETKEVGLEAIDSAFTPDREEVLKPEPDLDNAMLSKFPGEVTWKKRYRIAKDADPSKVSVTGELVGMYCSGGTDDAPGSCIPIRPPYEFSLALSDAVDLPAAPEDVAAPKEAVEAAPIKPRFEFEESLKAKQKDKLEDVCLVQYKLLPENAEPGDKVQLSIKIELFGKWHTYSMVPHDGSQATVFEIDSIAGLKPLIGFHPDRNPEIEHEDDLTHEVFHKQVTWTADFEVLPDAQPGEYGVNGLIIFQTCSNRCITHKRKFALGDVSKAVPVSTESNPTLPAAVVVAPKPQDQGLFGFLLTAVGFGFVALLTPCVWPMVPITVSFFLKQSEAKHHRPLLVALVFCGSIVATFVILGVGIAAIFGSTQVNALANNPWINIFIGIVFFTFAFNMLGLFEIRVPSSLLTFTANQEQAGGYIGAMFMALTFTLTSFTCTFAFAGSLLVAASQGQYYWPIIGMLAFGAAFASPFFVLALVPGMLKKLPKSGGWMNAVKVVMGLIEIGAAVKFFSVADLGWNPSEPFLFDFVFVMITWLVLSVVISLYLLGVFRLAHDVPPVGISVGRLVLVMLFFGLSLNLAVALIPNHRGGGWIMDQILALAPPHFDSDVPAAATTGETAKSDLPTPFVAKHGIRYAVDVDNAIKYATSVNQPMLYDFTGVNCANCRKMEQRMTKPHNRERLDKLVLVQLYTDAVPGVGSQAEIQRILKRNRDLQENWFHDASLPAYAVVAPDGKTILSVLPGMESKDGQFAEFVDEGLKAWDRMNSKDKTAIATEPSRK
ncbi:MAG TPA: cytochrome c biogenesis protein CcdA [Schlesneria sp.]